MANYCYSLMDRNEPATSFMPTQGIKGFEEFMVVIEIPNAYGALRREVAYLALRSLYEAFYVSPVPATVERQVRSG